MVIRTQKMKSVIHPSRFQGKKTCCPRLPFYTFAGFLLIHFLLTGCAVMDKTAHRELTPVTDPPTGVYHQGKFVWNDLLTGDVATAKDFYGQLFGWTFEQLRGYTVISNEGQRIGGMVQVEEEKETPGVARWLCSLSVQDIGEAASLFKEEGGLVHEGPLEMVNHGKTALVSDPQGAQLLLLHATSGDPEDIEPVMGSWLWHELWSDQTVASLAFYQKLAGYDFFGETDDYLVLQRDGHWRAGIRYSSGSDHEMRWIPVVRVEDTEKIAIKVKDLGGEIYVGPFDTNDGSSVGLLVDPSGGYLLFQQWSPRTSEQEKKP